MEKPKPTGQPAPKGMVEVKRVQTPTGIVIQEFVRRDGQHHKGKS